MNDKQLELLKKEKQVIKEKYIEDKKNKPPHISEFCSKAIDKINECIEKNYIYSILDEFDEVFWGKTPSNLDTLFYEERKTILEHFLEEKQCDQLERIWTRRCEYPFQDGYYRRSFRSNNHKNLYTKTFNRIIIMYIKMAAENNLDTYHFLENTFCNDYKLSANIIADCIDAGDQYVISSIKDAVLGDNNTFVVSYPMILGCLRSHNKEMHILIGDLLLAAKLQEGLRQNIVECMDEATTEAFEHLLKLIIDNNLQRFSSISRAFGVWTNLLELDVSRPSVITKCLTTAYECITNQDAIQKYLQSPDKMEIYIALWATGFNEIEDTFPLLENLYDSGVKYKQIVALFFMTSTNFQQRQQQFAIEHLEQTDFEVFAWILNNLKINSYTYELSSRWSRNKKPVDPLYNPTKAEDVFNKMHNIYTSMPKTEMYFEDSGFHWVNTALTKDTVLYHMIYATYCSNNMEHIETLIEYQKNMSPDTRYFFLRACFKDLKTPLIRQTFLEFLSDKSSSVREEAEKQFKEKNITLSPEEYIWSEGLLRYKSVEMRKMCLDILINQPVENLGDSINRLLDNKNLDTRLGGLDLIIKSQSNSALKQAVEPCIEKVASLKIKSPKEEVLIKRVLGEDESGKYNKENGYGLYDPNSTFDFPVPQLSESFDLKTIFCSVDFSLYEDFIIKFNNLIDKYKDTEYEIEAWDGQIIKEILGTQRYNLRTTKRKLESGEKTFDFLPLKEIWSEFLEKSNLSHKMLYTIKFIYNMDFGSKNWDERVLDFIQKQFPFDEMDKIDDVARDLPYNHLIRSIINAYEPSDYLVKEKEFGYDISLYLLNNVPEDFYELEVKQWNDTKVRKNVVLENRWIRYSLDKLDYSDDPTEFEKTFGVLYNYYKNGGYNRYLPDYILSYRDFAKAFDANIITENEFYKELMDRPRSASRIKSATFKRTFDQYMEKYPKSYELLSKCIDRIVEIESKRGDSSTPVTTLSMSIDKYYGMEHMVNLLSGLDPKDTLTRGYSYYSNSGDKKQSISNLIKTCHPKANDDINHFKKLMKDKNISEKILINIALYAPQWVYIITKYLGWKGLSSACWYFIAHTQEDITDEKIKIIGQYSPIDQRDFKDGAFDIDWFKDCYKDLGEQHFKMVYDGAKYLTSGGNSHRRSQLFADATLGKLDIEETETRISDKRNKDHLVCYGLIPLGKSKVKDTLHRYNFIQEFAKQSKKFGAQRKASEAVACRIALENLARNAGYADVIRLTWSMEAESIKAIMKYFKPKKIKEYTTYIQIESMGKAGIVVQKDDKILKSVPAAIKKDKYIETLKENVKKLRDQYRRAVSSLEKAMEIEDVFKASELMNLEKNPMLECMIQSLVLKSKDSMGYLKQGFLVDIDGNEFKLKASDKLIVAHPVHLYESGRWSDYQKNIFESQTIQPFKQIFRELYLPNDDELSAKTSSMRYAGHQLQPGKLSALLKTRGWIAGGQKVYYKHDIVANLYGIPDYFSPSDVEAPTLHSMEFHKRKLNKIMAFTDIPKTIFSEVMRDVDLFVSVAHVGGVDPESSHSTVEMRCAIVREMLPLLKLTNVEIKGNHAFIKGSFGEYTVHMGSGVVHKMASGAVNILAVGSQHRGRLFLPFMDEDPRTAEIVSKIVLLADDKKIKDPSILSQIRG